MAAEPEQVAHLVKSQGRHSIPVAVENSKWVEGHKATQVWLSTRSFMPAAHLVQRVAVLVQASQFGSQALHSLFEFTKRPSLAQFWQVFAREPFMTI